MVAQDRKDCTPTPTPSLFIFTYGTLKRGFSNHKLMQDLMRTGDATFVATCRTAENYPLVCGPYRVPFLLNMAGSGQPVTGELYAVSVSGLARLDELEGISRGPLREAVYNGGARQRWRGWWIVRRRGGNVRGGLLCAQELRGGDVEEKWDEGIDCVFRERSERVCEAER